MKLRSLASVGLLFVLAGCSQGAGGSDEKTGALSLTLIGTDSAGEQYRLRNATFEVYGYPSVGGMGPVFSVAAMAAGTAGLAGAAGSGGASGYYYETVSSEEDPNAPDITRRLVPGYYYVNLLNSDFYMEHLTPNGAERVDKVVLLSDRSISTYVWNGGVSDVYYQFGIGGDLIDFRSGELKIKITVEHPGENQGTGGFGGAGGSTQFAGGSNFGGFGGLTGDAGGPQIGGRASL